MDKWLLFSMLAADDGEDEAAEEGEEQKVESQEEIFACDEDGQQSAGGRDPWADVLSWVPLLRAHKRFLEEQARQNRKFEQLISLL